MSWAMDIRRARIDRIPLQRSRLRAKVLSIEVERQWNTVEGKNGQGNRCFGLGLIREKSPATQGSTIALNVLEMNHEKLLELLFVFFAYWLPLLLCHGPGKGSRYAHPSNQAATV